jgi:hypothetical protein
MVLIKKENTKATFVIPKTMFNELIEIAEFEGRSLSNLLLYIVTEYLRNRKRPNKE